MDGVHTDSRRVPTIVVRGEVTEARPDAVAGEEPLQIRACGPDQAPQDIAVTMRTPGSETELAVGFLVAEGLLDAADALPATFELGDPVTHSQPHDEILVRLPKPLDLASVTERHFIATASCGVCGRASTDELVARVEPLASGPAVGRSALQAMPARMRAAQSVFETTGGLHAAALFTPSAELIELREDIGRHNAVDKVIGAAILADLPIAGLGLLVTGRISAELAFKAARGGIAWVATPSVPSTLADTVARHAGMTLIGRAVSGTPQVHHP
jgi:FdhD protein